MSTYSDAILDASELTTEARAAAQVAATGYALERWLPSQDNLGLTFNFDVNQTALTEVASFRAWDTAPDFGQTDGSESRQGNLPPIGRQYRVGEYDQLSLYADNQDSLEATLRKYARRAAAAIAARVELARGEAIATGKVTISERNLNFQIDYGRPAGNTVTAAKVWTDITSTPITDLDSWSAVYGKKPDMIRFDDSIMSALQRNTDMIKLALQRGTDLPGRISITDVLSVLADYGYKDVATFNEKINGQSVLPSTGVYFLPDPGSDFLGEGALGTTDWGITAEAINPKYGISGADRPGIFAMSSTEEVPEGTFLVANAIVLPIMTNAAATFAATVSA